MIDTVIDRMTDRKSDRQVDIVNEMYVDGGVMFEYLQKTKIKQVSVEKENIS